MLHFPARALYAIIHLHTAQSTIQSDLDNITADDKDVALFPFIVFM